MSRNLTIESLGRQGDGVASSPDGPAHVPFTLPGETVTISDKGRRPRLERVIEASPLRREPVCRHFGECGGCRLQHFEIEAYREWKRGLVAEALARAGIETEIAPLKSFATASRRRAVFSAVRTAAGPKPGIVFGFQERDTNRIVDLAECPVLVPAIVERIEALRALCQVLAPGKGVMKLNVLASENGLDLAAETESRIAPKSTDRAIALAGESGFARLSVNGEILAQFRTPFLDFGGSAVAVPPGGFVQAVAAAEQAMAERVTSHLEDCKRVADLFCGAGTFALRLAAASEVHAIETDAAAIDALDRAWRGTGGRLKRITSERRDLFRRPMQPGELTGFDGLVFDPPRAGAQAQARELASSDIGKIAAVSCNPVTLARDLSLLVEGGYRVVSVLPLDQFVFTPHVEAVALLQR
ncbi:MAG: class I SAM-dependent RNA methyltransferase [Nitratireductor sp.]|nr:class I SAM-dependent RNA methyltransferase [Nitratireductor sp.]